MWMEADETAIEYCKDDAAKIVSYLTFDGHLGKNLREFYLSSSSLETLKEFEELVARNFHLRGNYEIGDGFGESYKCRFYSAKTSRLLVRLGTPKGDKMLTPFSLPGWIKSDREMAMGYLRVAFGCEGSIRKRANAVSYEVSFKLHKSEELLSEGRAFVEELKKLLLEFGIQTTNTGIQPGNSRKKDGKTTNAMRFAIKTCSLAAFAHEIGFSDEAKQARIEEALKALKMRKTLSYHLSKSGTTRVAFEKQFCGGTGSLEPAQNRLANGAVG